MVEEEVRYVVILYKTDQYEGTITSCEEGEVFWMSLEDMKKSRLALRNAGYDPCIYRGFLE